MVLAVVLLVPLAPGWDAVKRSFFNGEVFAKTFPGLLDAFLMNVAIFLWCAPIIAVLGLVIALFRDVRSPAWWRGIWILIRLTLKAMRIKSVSQRSHCWAYRLIMH